MKALPTKLGAEPKKLALLGGLVLLAGVVYFINRTPDSGPPQASSSAVAPNPVPLKQLPNGRSAPASRADALTPMPGQRTQRRGDSSIQDFKPTLKLAEGADVSRIDPTLRLDLIAKLRELELEGGARSLFDFGAAPKPKAPPVPPVAPIKPANPSAVAADANPAGVPTPPGKPVLPSIPLKFYGYVNGSRGGSRQAFFLEGEDIFVAGENETIHSRYKVIRIGINSAVVEDTTNKNQQTLPLVEELPG
jgi:hypothetical protein